MTDRELALLAAVAVVGRLNNSGTVLAAAEQFLRFLRGDVGRSVQDIRDEMRRDRAESRVRPIDPVTPVDSPAS